MNYGPSLGSGNHSLVQRVQLLGSGTICALKIISLKRSVEVYRPQFENEIRNMQRVSNWHIASFYAAYILEEKTHDPRFGILMQPAANSGTLDSLISVCRHRRHEVSKEQMQVLPKSFGCLATALRFIHQHMIRHKDVKPANILLHDGRVLLADFGSSWDGVALGTLATNNAEPKGHTDRYAAPEVKSGDERDAKSDVFALGAVFYEMLCAIDTSAKWYDVDYYESLKALRPALGKWTKRLPDIASVINDMLNPNMDRRPSASTLVRTLPEKYFCGQCLQENQGGPAGGGNQQQAQRTAQTVVAGPSGQRTLEHAQSGSRNVIARDAESSDEGVEDSD